MQLNAGNSQTFKFNDAASYDQVSEQFDRLTERFTGAIANEVVRLGAIREGETILDVGSGTGVVTFRAASAVSGTGRVCGIDLSDGMLAKAESKARESTSNPVPTFLKMDAENLTFDDASIDCILSLFALRHFPNPDIALAQMRRVLRPGGQLVIAVGSGPPLFSKWGLAALIKKFASAARRLRGRSDLIACDYLNGLVDQFIPADNNIEDAPWTQAPQANMSVPLMLRAAGFRRVRSSWSGNDSGINSIDEFWELQITFSSKARKRVAAATPDQREILKAEFFERCANALAKGSRLRYPIGALIVTATR